MDSFHMPSPTIYYRVICTCKRNFRCWSRSQWSTWAHWPYCVSACVWSACMLCWATFGVLVVQPLREGLTGVWGLLMHALAPSGLHNSHCQLKSRCRAPTLSCLSSSHTVKSLSEQMKPPAQHCRGTLSRNSHSPAPTGLTKSRSCHETLASDQGSPVSKPQESHFAMN